jgi:predicted component of type VI protein secretion system
MSKTLSLKLDESVFADTESIVHKQRISRNAYINAAIRYYNSLMRRKELRVKLEAESLLVREESMAVYRSFEEADLFEDA